MHRSEEVKQILLEILAQGLLRIRVSGWDGRGDECAHEADHLHNVPSAIRECTVASVSHYYNVDRAGYLEMDSKAARPALYEPYWERLRAILVEAGIEG